MAATLNHRARVATTSLVLFCLSLCLTAYSARNPGVAGSGYVFLAEIQRPFQIAAWEASSAISGVWDGYINLLGVNEENRHLLERLATLEALNSRLLEHEHENERLRKLLQLAEERKFESVAANVIGFDPARISQMVIVDRGSADGITIEMPVVIGEGVVGQVITVSPNSSRILLITDPSSGVDGLVQDGRVRGVVRGTASSARSEFQYVLRDETIKIGDRVVTSGLDGIFPKGLLIGIISQVDSVNGGMFQSVQLKPIVNFDELETVLIIKRNDIE